MSLGLVRYQTDHKPQAFSQSAAKETRQCIAYHAFRAGLVWLSPFQCHATPCIAPSQYYTLGGRSILAPLLMRSWTMSSWPYALAMKRGDTPSCIIERKQYKLTVHVCSQARPLHNKGEGLVTWIYCFVTVYWKTVRTNQTTERVNVCIPNLV